MIADAGFPGSPKSGFPSMRAKACGFPLHVVRPQDWKRYFSLPKEKEHARALAISYYPQAPLARVKDHNRAEALLIARYGWERLR